MGALFLPAIEHQLIDRFRTIHRRWKPVAFLDRFYHILIRPVPVRPLAVRHHLPTHDTHAPNVGSAREFTERYRLRCRPPYRYFTALSTNGRLIRQEIINMFSYTRHWLLLVLIPQLETVAHPGRVSSFCGTLNLSTESKIGDLANKSGVD